MDSETNDTNTTQLPGPLSAADVKTRAERRPATIDIAAGTVSFAGGIYTVADLPPLASKWCELRGLASRLQASDDAEAEFAKLKAGTIPSHGPAKPKELDPWRRAYAHAFADKQAKERGHKLKSPEHVTLIDEAMQTAATMDRDALKKARTIPAVVTHWNRITGNEAAL